MNKENAYRNFIFRKIILVLLVLIVAPVMAAGTVTWDGGGADNNWFNSNNWDTAQVPADGDDVVIGSGASVVLSNSTANLGSFMITNATLTFTNWNTAIDATNVTIQKSGKMTLPSAFTNNAMSNRVWVACSNLLIESGGSINADSRGYAGGAVNTPGYGPGAGTFGSVVRAPGGSYGGVGGFILQYSTNAPAYGSSNAPVDPGSGGGGGSSGIGGNGGGAVRIEATGAVTVNGTITANGGNGGSSYGAGGSGGGIYIDCNTFSGTNGTIRADAGEGTSSSSSGAGGGGRIAINYNTNAQVSAPMPSVTFSVLGGTAGADGDLGTIYFSDIRLLPETITYNGQLIMGALTNWSVNNLTISNVYIRFSQEGFTLTVTNDLKITSSGRLNLGGIPARAMTNTTWPILDERIVGPCLYVGGNLILTNSGKLYVQAGVTNASTTNYGALVSARDVFVASGSWIYPYSQATNGGSALFRVGNLTIASGGGINADGRGFAGGEKVPVPGHGPGWGETVSGGYGLGAGYGGEAGFARNGYGETYGSSNAPMDPGNGGGGGSSSTYWYRYSPPYGGGLVRVEATGTISVYGTITANGISSTYPGAGSGGGIYLYCRVFIGATNAILRANGAAAGSGNGWAAGGGGRIAVWRKYDLSTGAISNYVNGGDNSSYDGEDGTIVWVTMPGKGTIIRIH